jgi:hypothetical protein
MKAQAPAQLEDFPDHSLNAPTIDVFADEDRCVVLTPARARPGRAAGRPR